MAEKIAPPVKELWVVNSEANGVEAFVGEPYQYHGEGEWFGGVFLSGFESWFRELENLEVDKPCKFNVLIEEVDTHSEKIASPGREFWAVNSEKGGLESYGYAPYQIKSGVWVGIEFVLNLQRLFPELDNLPLNDARRFNILIEEVDMHAGIQNN